MRFSLLVCALVMNFLINLGSDRTAIAQQATTVKQWTFNTDGDKEHWTGANCLKDVVVQDGVLRGIVTGRDPFIVVSDLDFPARPWNVFQARLRIVQDEPLPQRGGELFYANSNEGPFGGFSQAKTSKWTAPDANTWDIINIYPFWSKEGQITKLRLDFPAPAENQINKAVVEIDWIRIVDLKLESQPEIKPSWIIENGKTDSWDSPMFSLDAEQIGNWLTINASLDAPRSVEFSWMNERGVFYSTTVELRRIRQNWLTLIWRTASTGKDVFINSNCAYCPTRNRKPLPRSDRSRLISDRRVRRISTSCSAELKTPSSAPDTKPRSSWIWSTTEARTLQH